MNDSSGVLELLAAAVPAGPHDSELISLHRLARCIAVGFRMPVPVSGSTVVHALRGDDKWEGKPPASLPVYVRDTTGLRCLTDCDELPERKGALRHLAVALALKGCTINEVPASGHDQHGHAGRFLAVVEADAWRAFGLTDPAHAQAPPTPAPAVVQSEPTPAPAADSVIVDQPPSGPDLKNIAAVYLREVGIGQRGAINRAAAKLKRLDGKPMGRTTLVKRLKEANEAKIHTGYPPER